MSASGWLKEYMLKHPSPYREQWAQWKLEAALREALEDQKTKTAQSRKRCESDRPLIKLMEVKR